MSKANIVRTVVEIVVVGGLIGLVIDKEIRKKRALKAARDSIDAAEKALDLFDKTSNMLNRAYDRIEEIESLEDLEYDKD
jgi:hypothetical protein